MLPVLLAVALVALSGAAADAQPAPPWSGIAADEARPATPGYVPGSNEMSRRSMSADGRFVVFNSDLATLVPGDTNNWSDVFLRDRHTGELRRVSVASDGAEGNHYSAFATLSGNGRHIAFNSCATNFAADDTNEACDLFIHDRELGTTVRANLGPNGEEALITTQHHFSLSADGRYFVFNATFIPGDQRRVWLRDRDSDGNGVFDEPGTAVTTLVSESMLGSNWLFMFEDVAISGDGRWIAYASLTYDVNWNYTGTRLYLHDRNAGTTVRVDQPLAGAADPVAYSAEPGFSDSGHLVYATSADHLTEGDADGSSDVFVYDIATGTNTAIALTHPGAPELAYAWSPALSADGRFVTFTGAELGQWDLLYNVYVVDRQTAASYEISVRPDGSRDNHAGPPSISADASAIAFTAGAEMLLHGWGSNGVFVATGVALSPSEIEVPADGGTVTFDVTVPAGVAWTLKTFGEPGIDVSQASGAGPGTIDVTVGPNDESEGREFLVLLGTEQVRLHQSTRPTIYFVYPYGASPQGGTAIEIYGFGFMPGATVSIDGVAAGDVVVVDDSTITAIAPAHAVGTVMLAVTNPGGASSEYPFYYRDDTPPVVTAEIGGTLGANGWYTSDVSLVWSYEDPESTVFLQGCMNPYQQTTDIASLRVICNVMSDGGNTFAEVEINRDTVAPLIALSPSVPETYFQGQVVPIGHYCSDATSGIDTCTLSQAGPNLDTSAIGAFELSLTAVDRAGHSTSSATSYTVKMATAITVPPVTSVYGGAAALRATLLGSGTPLAGKTVTFFVDNVEAGTGITSASGDAVLNLPLAGRNAGTYTVRIEFAGDETSFASLSFGPLIVEKATPTVTWPAPAFITHGTALSGVQLNATSTVAGVFAYDPAADTVLPAGTHTLTAQFTPQDFDNYHTVSKTVTLKVKAVPVITWATPQPQRYPAFSSMHLNATANVPGTFVYNPPWNTLLPAGTHTLSATFTPANVNDYAVTTATVTLDVLKGLPSITWQPDPLVYKTPLGAAQLNASASPSGTFTYSPEAGTILPAGTHTLAATYTPYDAANWESATATRSLLVGQYPATVTWDFPAPISYGTPLGPVQQNANVYPADLAGTWSYYPPPGTVMEIGTHWITVVFHPDDPNYSNGSSYASITIDYAPTTVTWSNPAPIVYPATLGHAQLNATASVPGSFTYQPALGSLLPAGTHTLRATFTPADQAHYLGSSKTVSIAVAKRTPEITWNAPAGLTYGTALSAAQLNATSNVAGTFAYSPAIGTVLGPGTHTLSATFTPTDGANNLGATATTSITVVAATPSVSWPAPSGIVYGAALGASQLNATASVPGTFAYSPAIGTVLDAGTHTLAVTFTPDDAVNFTTASATVPLVVAKATPVLSWSNPPGIVYGTALSPAQLAATANVAGTFTYSPAEGTILGAGSWSLSVTFTPDAPSNYESASTAVVIDVSKATPVLTWPAPAPIVYPTPLSATQLNATANTDGTFDYAPVAGSVYVAGTHSIGVTFTPLDTANYTTAFKFVTIEVTKATPVVSWPAPASITYGTGLAAQLNPTANVQGTFAFSPAFGTVLPAGTHTLTATFTPHNTAGYTTATASVTLVVAPAALTVRADNASKVYGEALPAFTASGTGFVNGDSMATLSGSVSVATSATATSAPGTYALTASGVSSPNYAIAFAAGTLTVTKAATVVALTTTPSPSNNNQSVQLRAVVTAAAPGAGTPTGTVEFRENGTLLGTATLVNGVATMNKAFKRGTHPLTATYAGHANFTGSSGAVTHQTR